MILKLIIVLVQNHLLFQRTQQALWESSAYPLSTCLRYWDLRWCSRSVRCYVSWRVLDVQLSHEGCYLILGDILRSKETLASPSVFQGIRMNNNLCVEWAHRSKQRCMADQWEKDVFLPLHLTYFHNSLKGFPWCACKGLVSMHRKGMHETLDSVQWNANLIITADNGSPRFWTREIWWEMS